MTTAQPHGRLHGKTALITGSSSGLGRAIALAYAAEGANVCCVDLYAAPRHAVNAATGKADDIHVRTAGTPASPVTHEALLALHGARRADGRVGPRFAFVPADVADAAQAEDAVARCVVLFGRLDVMVNNAGVSVESQHVRPLKCHETPVADFDATMLVNVRGVFLGSKFALRQMVERQEAVDWDGLGEGRRDRWDRGWLVNTASIQGLVAYTCTRMFSGPRWGKWITPLGWAEWSTGLILVAWFVLQLVILLPRAPSLCSRSNWHLTTRNIEYTAMRFVQAVRFLTDTDSASTARRVQDNQWLIYTPPVLKTAMTQNLQGQPETFKEISDAHPFGGMGDPDDVARAAVFLASRDASWVTGVPLPIDGGYSAR